MLQTIENRSSQPSGQVNGFNTTANTYPTSTYISALSTEDALEEYIKANGNVHLAAERLHVPITLFMDTLSQDHVSLQRLLRTRLLLNMFTAFETAQTHLATAIPLMESEDIAKTYASIAQVLEKLTSNAQNVNINIHEYMMRMLPPEAREAFQVLTTPDPALSVIKLSDD